MVVLFVQLHFTTRVRYGFLSVQLNYTIRHQNIFQPQQLYVANKKMDLSTEVYSFDEFDLRNDKNKLYEDYLKGRFGGIGG